MKRPLLCIIMLAVMAATAVEQTQQGYVKTRGKLAADRKTVVAGERLSNAIVTIEKLSPVKSGTNGIFSFALPSGTTYYRLQSAELKGYVLADPDAVRQTHTFSKDVPLIVVLEDMKQREADLEAARKSVRNVMKREIRKKQDELDSLRDAHAITQAKYDSLVRDFWEYRQSSEKLVNDMAERYVSTDYDQLDDFNRQVQAYIESGQLTKADSLIRSKGSLQERFNRVKQYESTNTQREAEIQQEQEALNKSRQYTQKEKDDLANDLYRQHLIFLQQPMMQDSALYCLKLRADLDTTNVDALLEYAVLLHIQRKLYEAKECYLVLLRMVSNGNDEEALAALEMDIGFLYSELDDHASSEKYYKLALENAEKVYYANPNSHRALHILLNTQILLGDFYHRFRDYYNGMEFYKKAYDLALKNSEQLNTDDSYHSLLSLVRGFGLLTQNIKEYAVSEKLFKQALDNAEELYAANPDTYCADLANAQKDLGNLYTLLNDNTNSEKYLKLALGNYEKLYVINPDAYCSALAATRSSLGFLYSNLHDYASSEKYYKLALENYEKLYATLPDAYCADLASTQNLLGLLYTELHDYVKSEEYFKLALMNYEKLYTANPEAFRLALAGTQRNLGFLYRSLHDYINSERNYKLALRNYEKLYAVNPDAYCADLASTQNSLGFLYSNLHDYANSEKYYKLALVNCEKLYAANPEVYRVNLASLQKDLGELYRGLEDYTNSEKYYKLALENYENLFATNPEIYESELSITQFVLGILYYKLHDYSNSEKFYNLAAKNYEKIYAANPEAYREMLAMTYWSMVILYAQINDEKRYDTCLAKALELYSVLYVSNRPKYQDNIIELHNRIVLRFLVSGAVDEALVIARENYLLDKSNETTRYCLAQCLNGKAYQYANNEDYAKAISSLDEAMSLMPEDFNLYDSKGEILLMQGKDQEALKMWKKVLELNPKFLDEYPEGTTLSNGLKAKGLIK